MVSRIYLVYFVLGFLLEEDLFNALRAGGLSVVWRKSRLLTAEFSLIYYPVLVWFWGDFIPRAVEELRSECFARRRCEVYLRRSPWSPSWTGPELRYVDLADIQWRELRGSLGLLLAAAAALGLLVRLAVWATTRQPHEDKAVILWRGGLVPGVLIRLVPGLGFLAFVHGAGMAFPLMLVATVYGLTRALAGTRVAVPALWALALLAIAAKEPTWPLRPRLTFAALAGRRWAWLDAYKGEYDWAQSVNLMLLRLLSFALDCHAARRSGQSVAVLQRYGFLHCLSHACYAPLILAGPTIGFDDYLEQCATPKPSPTHMGWYILMLGAAICTLELFTHTCPCFALARSGELGRLGPRLGAAAVIMTLNLMWLKFLVLWRVARAWALLEGVDVPENMRRSLNNHYSLASFWRCWHASFNRWLVRYIYVPAGGRHRKVTASVLTFAFVALWHDFEVKLFAWGALNVCFLLCETAVTSAWQRGAEGLARRRPWLYRQVGVLGGATYIFVLCAVNMIGYSVGVGGISGMLTAAGLQLAEAAWVLLGTYAVFFSSVQVMLEVRQLDGSFAEKKKVSPR